MAKKKKKKGDDETPKKKKKPSRAVEEDDDDVPEEDPTKPKKRQDIFVGLSFLSLVFLITASVFYYQDFEEMALKPLPSPEVTIPALTAVSDKVK